MYVLQVDRCPHIWLWPNRLHFWLGDFERCYLAFVNLDIIQGCRAGGSSMLGVWCVSVWECRVGSGYSEPRFERVCFYWPPHAYVIAHPDRRIRSVHLAYLDHPGGYLHYNLEKSPTSITVYITHFMSKIPWRRKWHRLQCPCRGNPMDRGAWRATVHGVAREAGTT